jgi:hypothetical protein
MDILATAKGYGKDTAKTSEAAASDPERSESRLHISGIPETWMWGGQQLIADH